jgi:hypothetical protein
LFRGFGRVEASIVSLVTINTYGHSWRYDAILAALLAHCLQS